MTREDAKDMLITKLNGGEDTSYEWGECVRMAIMALNQEPKAGHWIDMRCDQCGQVDISKPNYCPNCGAKMEV